jgi:SAM-dependent MidA family methyltransferase
VGTSLASTLAEELADRIRQQGKVTFRDWMHTALYHPTLGYYNRSDLKRWGREGDYRTSPERSDLFAATLAHYFVSLFEGMRAGPPFQIVEFGAGNGKFAAGVLNILSRDYPQIFASTNYVIVESSHDSRARTEKELERLIDHKTRQAKAYRTLTFVGPGELKTIHSGIIFSNELLDAFPVHRIRKVDGELKELYVGVDSSNRFVWLLDDLSSAAVREFCTNFLPDLSEDQTVEVNLGIADWFSLIDEKLANGYVVTIDYGATAEELYRQPERHDGTLRAFSRHNFVDDVLSEAGNCDITSTVDWGFVMAQGKQYGFEVEEFAQLDKFLLNAGVLQELETRIKSAGSDSETAQLTASAREMILPGGMASSFQVLVQKR